MKLHFCPPTSVFRSVLYSNRIGTSRYQILLAVGSARNLVPPSTGTGRWTVKRLYFIYYREINISTCYQLSSYENPLLSMAIRCVPWMAVLKNARAALLFYGKQYVACIVFAGETSYQSTVPFRRTQFKPQ